MDPRSIEMLTIRLAAVDLRCSVLEVAEELPRIYRDLADALGPAEAGRRFDTALTRALAATAA
ncbi:hypothetical protein [Nitriliruptor alkaliphilus]|uniref:hypothetical protein n=1 Tax=Nitriliruptor alkaliphilus TaxID=427918 RepID=UPI0006967C6D|nr:hypothetical protein [Nitriliruptor alkaliphilus]